MIATGRRQQELLEALSAELSLRDPEGTVVARSSDLAGLARLTIDRVIDTAAVWQEHLGPLYDTEGVRELLSRSGRPVSRQAVSQRRNLLSLTTGSGRVVYPAFQFQGRGVVAGLAEVLEAVPESVVSRWTLASWLVSAEPDLDDDTPIRVLSDGGVERVMQCAHAWATSLSA